MSASLHHVGYSFHDNRRWIVRFGVILLRGVISSSEMAVVRSRRLGVTPNEPVVAESLKYLENKVHSNDGIHDRRLTNFGAYTIFCSQLPRYSTGF